jgi:hypothetical protein
MHLPHDAYQVEAANAILARLGDEALTRLKQDLFRGYGILLEDKTTYNFTTLQTALNDLLGSDAERFLTREILREMELLQSDDIG